MNFLNQSILLLGIYLLACTTPRPVSRQENKSRIHHVLCGQVGTHQATLVIQTLGQEELRVRVVEAKSDKTVFKKKVKTTASDDFLVKMPVDKLRPGQRYNYRISGTAENNTVSGQFQTFPGKPASYKIVFGSCQETGSESTIFDNIRQEEPLVFLQIGDLHYENIDRNCQSRFDSAYHRIFSSKRQAQLYQNTPLVYLWDDHDFGPNNSGADNPCRSVAILQYKKHFPHYPLALDGVNGPISQSFEIGRVRYVLSDLRSQKTKPKYSGCERIQTGSNFGTEAHLNWFFNELLEAKRKGQVVAWISSYPWINAPGGPDYKCDEDDDWGGYPEERTRIADFIKKNKIPVFILSGDAHMVAMDDGSHSDYATGGGAPLHVFHAGAIDRPGSFKGGPYSHGYSREQGQYGVIEVKDEGGKEICLSWYAKNKTGGRVKNQEGREIRMDFCLQLEN